MKGWALGLSALLLVGCGSGGGGGGGGGGGSLLGTYTLTGFRVTYDNGTVVTQNDVSTFSGTFILFDDNSMSQDITVNGTRAVATGTYSVLDGDTMYITDDSTSQTGTLTYHFDGTNLNTISDHQAGNAFTEIDYWHKVGPPPFVIVPTSLDESGASGGVVGGLAARPEEE